MLQFLLVDLGNTQAKWATSSLDGNIGPRGYLPTQDMTAAAIRRLSDKFPQHSVMLACVVPKMLPLFERAFRDRLHILTAQHPALRLPFKYPKPAELGADRIAAALAAHHDGIWPTVIVNCGTATAITVLNRRGELCGGMIAPGLHTQLRALLQRTAQLPTASLRFPKSLPATSTQDAIRAGVLFGFQGGVKEMVARILKALPPRPAPRILLTGGAARHLGDELSAELRPLLVFEGLRIMGARIFTPAVS